MSQEIQLRQPDRLPEVADPFGGIETEGRQHEAGLRKIHRLLRHRYRWCLLLSLIFATAGVFAGWKLPKPVWSAMGIVQIRTVIHPIISQTDENGSMIATYDPFVQSQVAMIKSQRVVQMAMDSDEWRAAAPDRLPGDPAAITDFSSALQVQWIGRSELITVAFQDRNPQLAQVAVKQVLAAYRRIAVDTDRESEKTRNDAILARIDELNRMLKQKRREILEIAKDDLRPLYQLKVQEVARLESQMNEVRVQLAGLPTVIRPTTQATALAQRDPAKMSVVEIAAIDARMEVRLRELEQAKLEVERLKLLNVGPRHPNWAAALAQIELRERAVDSFATTWRQTAVLNPMAVRAADNTIALTRIQLEARSTEMDRVHRELTEEAESLGKKIAAIENLKREEESLNAELGRVSARWQQLQIESKNQPRINVADSVETPLIAKDLRIQCSAVGLFMGVVLGFGIVLVFSAADRRLRNPEDVQSGPRKLSLLGVLPTLPDNLADPDQAAIAAHCVHQVRTLLQIASPSPDHSVFAVTSPASGTGKTSLTLSLGVSFAASNSRTLLIDCDLVGGGLTARVDAIIRRKIGQVLQREGMVTAQQVEMAMRVAQNTGRKLGEVLVELGYLTADDVSRALHMQEHATVGTLDALGGERLEECIAETGIENLAILPLGGAKATDISKLSLAAMRGLLQRAKQHYDTILIDTGPVPGSLEASLVAAAADSVVLVVSRGEHRPLAERCIQHLQEIGARVAGLVFNRAQHRDIAMSAPNARFSSVARGNRTTSVPSAEVRPGEFGPVAAAMTKRSRPDSTEM